MHYLLFTIYLLKEELVSNLHFEIKALKLTVYVLTLAKKLIRSVIHILRLCEITNSDLIGSCIIWPTFYNWLHL